MLSPRPESCCRENEYLQIRYGTPSCVPESMASQYCDASYACPRNFGAAQREAEQYYLESLGKRFYFDKGTGPRPELYCDNTCWNAETSSCNCNCQKSVLDLLKSNRVGAYHYGVDGNTFDSNNFDLNFLRVCKDPFIAQVNNNENYMSTTEYERFVDLEFIRTSRDTASNPSSMCGDDCMSECPGTKGGIPCSGNGICSKQCSCACFTLGDQNNQNYFLSSITGVGNVEIPEYGVGSAAAFKSPFRGSACDLTCPGYEPGLLTLNASQEDETFIMDLICSGQGTCILSNQGSAQCVCEPGYISGIDGNCEFKCPGNDCSGHGTCNVVYTGTSEFFVNGLLRVADYGNEVSYNITKAVYDQYPNTSAYDALNDRYYTLPANKDAYDEELTYVKYVSACPTTHPYVYNHGRHCCVFEKSNNGSALNERSKQEDCPSVQRLRCPTIDWYLENTDIATYVPKPRFIDNDQITEVRRQCLSSSLTATEEAECAEEARLLALNEFSSNPDEYTCDVNIAFVQSKRDKRPYYDSLTILQLGAGITEQLMYTWKDVQCKHIIINEQNDNNVDLTLQPQAIKVVQCATCSCVGSSDSGYWSGTVCDDCAYGFFGQSCSNFCLVFAVMFLLALHHCFTSSIKSKLGPPMRAKIHPRLTVRFFTLAQLVKS